MINSNEEIADWFKMSVDELNNTTILYANYTQECYEGQAFVVFLREGKLYEVHGSHCSCYGLEDQWDPEETTKEALMKRIDNLPNELLIKLSELA